MTSPGFKYYYYDPSVAAAVIALLFWIVATVTHLWQIVRTKTKFFIPFLIGNFMEFVGYCARVASAQQAPNYRLMAYVIQSTYILLAPTIMAASIYMELGRIVHLLDGESHSPISRRWLTKVFVTGDILCLLIQSGGGGISAAGKSIGTKIVIVGLGLQIAVFLCFIAVAIVFDIRIRRVPTTKSSIAAVPWPRHMMAIYVSSCLVFLRSAVRLVEYSQGFTGYIYTNEWCLYVLDFVPLLTVAVLFFWIHPSEINAWLKGGKAMRGWSMHDDYQVVSNRLGDHVALV